MTDLTSAARALIDTNRYMAVGTVDPDGRPRVTPVHFTHHDYRTYYWVSETTTAHSTNITARPGIAAVIFDSTVAIGDGDAAYLQATAYEVPGHALPADCARAAMPFTPADLSGPSPLRLYRADATTVEAKIRRHRIPLI